MLLDFFKNLTNETKKNNIAEDLLGELTNAVSNSKETSLEEKLQEFRKEGHLYMVEEDRNGRVFLTDITDEESNIVLEETSFPKELVKQATEGTVFIYKNGTYHFYSRDGFERIYD